MNVFWLSIFIASALIQATATMAGAQEPAATGPVAEMDGVMNQFREMPRPLPPGETAANRLFATPGWRERMTQYLAVMVVKCRVTKEDADAYYRAYGSRDLSSLRETEIPALATAAGRAWLAGNARVELDKALKSLRNLNDRRIVSLMAPILAETTVGIHGDDFSFGTTQESAGDMLGELARRGVIEKPRETNRYGGYDVESWRRWWAENRSKFDPVPAPLRAIDEGRTAVLAPSTPPPVAAAVAPAVAAVSPAPAPPPPIAAPAQDWRVLGAVGGGVLLGLGWWAFARRTPRK